MSCNLIDDGMLLFQLQCRLQFVPQLGNVSFDLPYPGLVQIAPSFGKVIDWQFLGCSTVDVVGQGW